MTGVALSSLHKFLLYGFIRKDCPRVKEGITLVAQVMMRHLFLSRRRRTPPTPRPRFVNARFARDRCE